MKRMIFSLLCLILSVNFMGVLSYSQIRFDKKVNISSIYKSEVSNFKENHFQPINNEVFLEVVKSAKRTYAKFIPHKEVVLYDKNGKTLKLLFSEDNRVFYSIEGYFKLSRRNALLVSQLFDDLDS